MAKKKVKVELCDTRGRKVTLAMEGEFDARKMKQMIELLEIATDSDVTASEESDGALASLKEQLLSLLDSASGRWFTCRDLSRMYLEQYGVPIVPAVTSTYLGRLYREGLVERRGPRRRMVYSVRAQTKVKSTM